MKKFQRPILSRTGRNVKDEAGSVRITLILQAGSRVVRGNITRTISVRNAKISEVAAAIEKALFDE